MIDIHQNKTELHKKISRETNGTKFSGTEKCIYILNITSHHMSSHVIEKHPKSKQKTTHRLFSYDKGY